MALAAAGLQVALVVTGVAAAWVSIFELNTVAFSELELNARASWIFLPAAFRIIFVLLFSRAGVVGLVLGAYFTLPHDANSPFIHEAMLALTSGIAPLFAIYFCRRFFDLKSDLEGLRGVHILALSVACGLVNTVLLDSYLTLALEPNPEITQVATIFVGDVLGSVIVLTAIAISLWGFERMRAERA